MKKQTVPVVDSKRCKGCGICAAFCPQDVFDRDELGKALAMRAEKCIGCKLCEFRCPDYAIRVREV